MKLRLLFIVILLCIAGGASADDADRLIADFDRKADVASANKFFEFLDRREFTDSKMVFSKAVHADSLRQKRGIGRRSGTMTARTIHLPGTMPSGHCRLCAGQTLISRVV